MDDLSYYLEPSYMAQLEMPVISEMPSPPRSEEAVKVPMAMPTAMPQDLQGLGQEQLTPLIHHLASRVYYLEQMLAAFMSSSSSSAAYMPSSSPSMQPSSLPSPLPISPPTLKCRQQDPSLPSMNQMSIVCEPVFAKDPHPSNQTLLQIAHQFMQMLGSDDRRGMVGHVRKWFRKRRDENGQKVFQACIELIQPYLDSGATVNYIRTLMGQDTFRQQMMQASKLDITDKTNAQLFLDSKIEAYFTRRVHSR